MAWVWGVYGAVERRLAAPAVVGDSAWFLTKTRVLPDRTTDDDDDETGLPPSNPPGSSNRKPQRNSDFDFHFFAVSIKIAKKKLAIKFWRFSVLGMGVWGDPGFVVVVVVVVPAKPGSVSRTKPSREKNETADDGGDCVPPRPTARCPSPRPRPTPPTATYGIAKNGELLGPKVKGRMGYSKANI